MKKRALTVKSKPSSVTLTGRNLLMICDLRILERLKAQELPIVDAYRLNRICAIVGPECLRVGIMRNELVTEDISTEIEGGRRQVKNECLARFHESLAPLLSEEVTFQVTPLTASHLVGIKLSGEDIDALGPLLNLESLEIEK